MELVNGGWKILKDNWVENDFPHKAMHEKWTGVTTFFDTKMECDDFTDSDEARLDRQPIEDYDGKKD